MPFPVVAKETGPQAAWEEGTAVVLSFVSRVVCTSYFFNTYLLIEYLHPKM